MGHGSREAKRVRGRGEESYFLSRESVKTQEKSDKRSARGNEIELEETRADLAIAHDVVARN